MAMTLARFTFVVLPLSITVFVLTTEMYIGFQLLDDRSSAISHGNINEPLRRIIKEEVVNEDNRTVPVRFKKREVTQRKRKVLTKPKQKVKILLAYTKVYGYELLDFPSSQKWKTKLANCEYKCKWVANRTYYNKSDAVIFHLYNNLENKDFVYSKLPIRYNVDQKWILMAREPPAFYYPEQLRLLNGMFNLSMTFQSKADIFIPYGETLKRVQHMPNKDYLKGRNKTVAWVVSNCITSSGREKYVEQLKEYLDVQVFGKCGKRVDTNYTRFMAKMAPMYKFYLAFENSDCEDYITEKFWMSLKLGMIPIVRGQRIDYKKFAPPNSYIHADSFQSPEHLAQHLKDISKNQTILSQFHKWREDYKTRSVILTPNKKWMCDLCTQVYTAPRKTIDVYEQFSETTQCFANLDKYGIRNRTGEHMENIARA